MLGDLLAVVSKLCRSDHTVILESSMERNKVTTFKIALQITTLGEDTQ